MQSIGSSILAALGVRPAAKEGKSPAASSVPADQPVKTGIQVDLSTAGQARSAKAFSQSTQTDIEQSGLPDSVQKILRGVRDAQKRIEQIDQQLQAILTDKRLAPDIRQGRATGLQTMQASLQRQIATSTSDLSSLMNTLHLGQGDKMKAGMLVLAKM
jgi:uncharacterized membrane protein